MIFWELFMKIWLKWLNQINKGFIILMFNTFTYKKIFPFFILFHLSSQHDVVTRTTFYVALLYFFRFLVLRTFHDIYFFFFCLSSTTVCAFLLLLFIIASLLTLIFPLILSLIIYDPLPLSSVHFLSFKFWFSSVSTLITLYNSMYL